jgi:CheY-like chemotaxis protein
MLINNNTIIRVTLADDDIDDCTMFKEALEHINMKYSFNVFHSGTDLLSHLNTAYNLPHIVFLDLNMPGLSEYTNVKSNP